jgi:hypothetical protein
MVCMASKHLPWHARLWPRSCRFSRGTPARSQSKLSAQTPKRCLQWKGRCPRGPAAYPTATGHTTALARHGADRRHGTLSDHASDGSVSVSGKWINDQFATDVTKYELGSPEIIVNNVIQRDISTQISIQEKKFDEKIYFTPQFFNIENDYFAKHGQEFDADPLTGTQESDVLKVKKIETDFIAETKAMVKVYFLLDWMTGDDITCYYTMVKNEISGWLIDDIAYVDVGTPPQRTTKSLRQIAEEENSTPAPPIARELEPSPPQDVPESQAAAPLTCSEPDVIDTLNKLIKNDPNTSWAALLTGNRLSAVTDIRTLSNAYPPNGVTCAAALMASTPPINWENGAKSPGTSRSINFEYTAQMTDEGDHFVVNLCSARGCQRPF